jgi:hypothetical protein
MNSLQKLPDLPNLNKAANAAVVQRFGNCTLSPEVRQNLVIAAQINLYVKQTVPFIVNDYTRCKESTPEVEKLTEEQLKEIYKTRETLDNGFKASRKSPLKNILDYAAQVEKVGISNCDGLACVGFKFGLANFPNTNIEIFDIQNGNHSFLVVGRKANSSPHAFEFWGPAAVSDSWALDGADFYPASEIKIRLQNLVTSKEVNGKFHAEKESFNPAHHVLALTQGKPKPMDKTFLNLFGLLVVIGFFLIM